jgi:hypothetical protein
VGCPVGLEYRILGLICRFTGARVDHAAMWYSLVSPSRIGLRRTWWPARLITRGGLSLGLGRCKLRQRSVWPRCVEVVQVDREDPA